MARYLVARLFGTLVAETILAGAHVRPHQQAGHMDASDLIKALQNTLRGGGGPHVGGSCCLCEPLAWVGERLKSVPEPRTEHAVVDLAANLESIRSSRRS